MESGSIFDTLSIERDGDTKTQSSRPKIVLRDTIPLSKGDPKQSKSAIHKPKASSQTHKRAFLKFTSVAIEGRLATPRMPFGSRPILGGRADEGLELDFLEAIETIALDQARDSRSVPQF